MIKSAVLMSRQHASFQSWKRMLIGCRDARGRLLKSFRLISVAGYSLTHGSNARTNSFAGEVRRSVIGHAVKEYANGDCGSYPLLRHGGQSSPASDCPRSPSPGVEVGSGCLPGHSRRCPRCPPR
jgi:hypothetical protein